MSKWIKRKDRFYDSIVELLKTYKKKELLAYFVLIVLSNKNGAKIFKEENSKLFMLEMRRLIDDYEIDKVIKYKEFRKGVAELVEKYTNSSACLQLLQLGTELFDIDEDENALRIADRIFGIEIDRTVLEKLEKNEKQNKENW